MTESRSYDYEEILLREIEDSQVKCILVLEHFTFEKVQVSFQVLWKCTIILSFSYFYKNHAIWQLSQLGIGTDSSKLVLLIYSELSKLIEHSEWCSKFRKYFWCGKTSLNMSQSLLLILFLSQSNYKYSINFNCTNWESIDVELGIPTWDCRMVGKDRSIDLWWAPWCAINEDKKFFFNGPTSASFSFYLRLFMSFQIH